ncbi:Gmad2 immunoglobulin-like domain-containing protein [Paenibacillus xylaniclasticus]|uniref:Gmad2 immunoglobulin-like domain-containing protein n=1 Tax=Paenibacillus xylaniclasticus TaxID=588083 RepID=UPI000FDA2DE0|nr:MULTISPECIES: Gmad2 immunoglobulin-like domain-containing protein [Paenibacillus]GFN32844.1 hypothetical protein PCURB6_31040 [Paenibacillus curdlanolyticus]
MTTTRRRALYRWISAALVALMLAIVPVIIGGCAEETDIPDKPTATDNASNDDATSPNNPGDDSSDSGPKPIDNPEGDSDSGNAGPEVKPSGGGDSDGAGPDIKPSDSDDSSVKEPVIVAENSAFRVFEPAENSVVGTTFTVRGEARVFEAAFSYSFEDGHNTLAEGHVMADMGAPEWGQFEFTVTFEKPTSPFGILTLYESSAKDGSPIHKLQIAVQFSEDLLK